MTAPWEAVIGLEVHAQLLTRSKCFCACSTAFGAPPNSHVCPVCLALPGALPVLNAEALRLAARAALALHSRIAPVSVFARKNYFYPDLPKGYQISQFELPLASGGWLQVDTHDPKGNPLIQRRVGITRVHIEDDAGKNLHGFGGWSVVDLNRAGTPLIEIVGEPDLRSAEEAAEYLRQLRNLLMFLGVCDGNLEQGSLRCDINVSIRKQGDSALGTRTEIKNVNSFRFAQHAIQFEIARQIAVLSSGGRVVQETRGWDDKAGRTVSQRSKEEAHDYRYFPDPDLPPLRIDPEWLQKQQDELPELPVDMRKRFVDAGLSAYAAGVLTSHPAVARFFDAACKLHGDPTRVANFVMSEVMRDSTTDGLEARFTVSPEQLAQLLKLVDAGTISGKQAKEVYSAIANTDHSPADVVRDKGMAQLSDVGELETICARIIEQNAKNAASYRAGKTAILGFFVGQVMKETRGSASPALVNEILKRLLS
ncbi:MAG: Asp-tRNA(Asn)/Glu-tRNA(Gln) amidotransferase subunit GatB [Deltaproteobacteria bacterium]|nr:Asp-tRNA(Asn)/Glu-tRNA(Gln) amidotransferase subunit GatB [Deltaproteobacteria bacterium]